MSLILKIQDLHFAYRPGQFALEHVNLEIQSGDFLAVLGPNGGGKTTLLKLMVGLLKPTHGITRLLGGEPIEQVHRVGYLPQHTDINPDFPISVLDVVLMGRLRGTTRRWGTTSTDKKQALIALERVGVAEFKNRRIGSLSGGQRQRVLIARALVTKPDLLLLDEPTASVDAAGKAELYELLAELNRTMTIVVISHDISIIPMAVKSIACVNRTLYFHPIPEITEAMLKMMYGSTNGDTCPVELVAHGVPHRVLSPHQSSPHDRSTSV